MNDDRYRPGFETEHAALARLVGAYADDELAPELRVRVEAHLASCEECSGEARIQAAVRARLGAIAPRAVPAEFRERVLVGLAAVPAGSVGPERGPRELPLREIVVRRRWLAVGIGAGGWLVAAGLAGMLVGRPAPRAAGMTMTMGPLPSVAVDSTPSPMVDEALRDFRRVTAANLPTGVSVDSLQSELAFSLPALHSPHMQFIAAWRTDIDGEPAGALAYICHNRLVIQYVVSDVAFFRLARIRQAVATAGLYAAGGEGLHTVGWPTAGSGSFLVGEFSASELAAMRL